MNHAPLLLAAGVMLLAASAPADDGATGPANPGSSGLQVTTESVPATGPAAAPAGSGPRPTVDLNVVPGATK